MKRALTVFTLLAFTILAPAASRADESDARVARVSYISGDVSYQRGDDEGWNGLLINTPLVTGDSFYAPDGGRAEVNLGNGVIVRVDGATQVDIVNNTRDIAQLGLTGGGMDLSARSFPPGFTLEIDTPSGAATIVEPGRYRVEVTDRLTTYSVVRGSITLAVDGQQLDVREGEGLQLESTDPPTYGYVQLSANTPFYAWADDRDSRAERSVSARYVNHDVVGCEDLDDHGTWHNDSEYGRLWVPSHMRPGWAPYQSGRWIWQDPYGWTWVSDESWGWAPYHYGRWVYVSNTWGWVPPPPRGYRGPEAVMRIQPIYAPALVAFVGGSNWGLSLSIGGPAIGWVPLAPRETYYYPWQPAPRVVNNYTNITVINAVTVVNYNTFATGSVRPIRVERAQIEHAPVMGLTAVGVVPGRASLIVSPDRHPEPKALPRARAERPLVARLVPPPKPEPFAQKVVEIEKTGRPVARPVAVEAAVGKPFVPGVSAPAGVRPFTAPPPVGNRPLNAKRGNETRAPKNIQRDIAPPVAAARPLGQTNRQVEPPPAPEPPPINSGEKVVAPPHGPPAPPPAHGNRQAPRAAPQPAPSTPEQPPTDSGEKAVAPPQGPPAHGNRQAPHAAPPPAPGGSEQPPTNSGEKAVAPPQGPPAHGNRPPPHAAPPPAPGSSEQPPTNSGEKAVAPPQGPPAAPAAPAQATPNKPKKQKGKKQPEPPPPPPPPDKAPEHEQ